MKLLLLSLVFFLRDVIKRNVYLHTSCQTKQSCKLIMIIRWSSSYSIRAMNMWKGFKISEGIKLTVRIRKERPEQTVYAKIRHDKINACTVCHSPRFQSVLEGWRVTIVVYDRRSNCVFLLFWHQIAFCFVYIAVQRTLVTTTAFVPNEFTVVQNT